MKMNKPVIRSGLALWLLVALLLGGCTAKGEPVPPMEVSQDMPPTLEEGVAREGSFEAKLYFLSGCGWCRRPGRSPIPATSAGPRR